MVVTAVLAMVVTAVLAMVVTAVLAMVVTAVLAMVVTAVLAMLVADATRNMQHVVALVDSRQVSLWKGVVRAGCGGQNE